MFIRVEPSSGVPNTRQIADQIRAQCASGVLARGERLPSIRALARELAVNQNTINPNSCVSITTVRSFVLICRPEDRLRPL